MSCAELEALIEARKAEGKQILGRNIEPYEMKIFIHDADWREVIRTVPPNRNIEILGGLISAVRETFMRVHVFKLANREPAFVVLDLQPPL